MILPYFKILDWTVTAGGHWWQSALCQRSLSLLLEDWLRDSGWSLIIVVIKQITLTQSHNNQLSDFQSSMFIMIKLIFSAAEKLWSVDPNPWIENTCQPQIKLKAPWFTKVLLHASHINQLTVTIQRVSLKPTETLRLKLPVHLGSKTLGAITMPQKPLSLNLPVTLL